jgi:hypothetical protein
MSDNELQVMLDAEMTRLASYTAAAVASLLETGVNNGQRIDSTLYDRIAEFARLGGKMRCVIEVEPDTVIRGEMVRDIGDGRIERFELFSHVIPGGPDVGEGVH